MEDTTTEIILRSHELMLADLTGQVSARSKRIYRNDAKMFARWITEQGLAIETLTRSDMIAYRSFLFEHYQRATAARMLSIARRLLKEAVHAGRRVTNPAEGIAGIKVSNETPHTALTKGQARELLEAIPRNTIMGLRDYALLLLLMRTGIRRAECAALSLGDLKIEQGHRVLIIQHGKGDKRRMVKLPVDVARAIEDYLKITGRSSKNDDPQLPLFLGCTKGHQSTKERVSEKLIERTVIKYGKKIDVDLTPHGLRATFITLAMEGGAKLEQVQYAAGHSDPRTTERYQKRKLNLDDNAVDYIKL